ncbi:pyridine nucleotide-disulfide oxidoreductase [Chryseobacterium sp. Leaf180]|uniref:NAD(P)/FAD-dependent oxidoreductase n=1 Tax=Chryseobacterium sp. Leaf180 TaxID=1736289 RepID=UPI0006F2ED77|nr:NAD(P)/FAD-dependent oxidoreductase [Chryseobacterium sp. Leaf180]KQR94440.1 pyridine nucleotide-disulfide oxidoreductase [Chryseobacterium sp. Leaf180]
MKSQFEVIIIGGSYAGLSAAMSLGRAMRNVLVIDSGLPCNRQTPQSHNVITLDGEKPADIAAKARDQVLQYPTVQLINDVAVNGRKTDRGFEIGTRSGKVYMAEKLIFAAGVKDLMPDIPGFAECWGISVIHCPYCHGYEVRNTKTGILGNGDAAFHYAQLIRNWSEDLTIFTNGTSAFTAAQAEILSRHSIPVIEKEIQKISHHEGMLHELVFSDGSVEELKAMYSRPPSEQHCTVPEMLGCEMTEHGLIAVDAFQKTTLQNVMACGDCATPFRSVAAAIYSGNLAGAMLNNRMTEEAFAR